MFGGHEPDTGGGLPTGTPGEFRRVCPACGILPGANEYRGSRAVRSHHLTGPTVIGNLGADFAPSGPIRDEALDSLGEQSELRAPGPASDFRLEGFEHGNAASGPMRIAALDKLGVPYGAPSQSDGPWYGAWHGVGVRLTPNSEQYIAHVLAIAARWFKAEGQYPRSGVSSCAAELLKLTVPEDTTTILARGFAVLDADGRATDRCGLCHDTGIIANSDLPGGRYCLCRNGQARARNHDYMIAMSRECPGA